MDKKVDLYIIFFINKNGLNDFVLIKAINLKDAIAVSRAFAKATKCKVLGVTSVCVFKKFDNL